MLQRSEYDIDSQCTVCEEKRSNGWNKCSEFLLCSSDQTPDDFHPFLPVRLSQLDVGNFPLPESLGQQAVELLGVTRGPEDRVEHSYWSKSVKMLSSDWLRGKDWSAPLCLKILTPSSSAWPGDQGWTTTNRESRYRDTLLSIISWIF